MKTKKKLPFFISFVINHYLWPNLKKIIIIITRIRTRRLASARGKWQVATMNNLNGLIDFRVDFICDEVGRSSNPITGNGI